MIKKNSVRANPYNKALSTNFFNINIFLQSIFLSQFKHYQVKLLQLNTYTAHPLGREKSLHNTPDLQHRKFLIISKY